MSDQSHDQPQYETVDVPPNPEILLGWARRLFEHVPALVDSIEAVTWSHQRLLWEKSYEQYKNLPQPDFAGELDEIRTYDHALNPSEVMARFAEPAPDPEATLTLLNDVGPILGLPIGTKPEQVRWAEEVAVEWWLGQRAGAEPLVLPWPVDVRDLRG